MTPGAKTRAPSIGEDIGQQRPFRTKSQEALLGLVRTADDAKRPVGEIVERAGITLQQYNVLRILRGADERGLPTLLLGERIIERTPGVTRLIDRMEKKGLVTRERCTEDRRRVWCRITPRGLATLGPLDEPVNDADDSIFAPLDDCELERLMEYLDRVRAHLADR
jgi:DNA-binding MarR family transcriptional regulator